MKPIAYFFSQFTDYGQLIKEQSMTTSPSVFGGGMKKSK